jgi:hypothetical protein
MPVDRLAGAISWTRTGQPVELENEHSDLNPAIGFPLGKRGSVPDLDHVSRVHVKSEQGDQPALEI